MPWQERTTRSLLLPLIFPLNACPFHGNPRQNQFTTNLMTLDFPSICNLYGIVERVRRRFLLSKLWVSMLMFTNSWEETAECIVGMQHLKFGTCIHSGSAAFEIWKELIPFQTLPRPLYMILGGKQPLHSFSALPSLRKFPPLAIHSQVP